MVKLQGDSGPRRLVVRTTGFQSVNRGSIPLGAACRFGIFILVLSGLPKSVLVILGFHF